MPTSNETIRELAEENQTRKILRMIEKAEKEGKTVKEIIEIVEKQPER